MCLVIYYNENQTVLKVKKYLFQFCIQEVKTSEQLLVENFYGYLMASISKLILQKQVLLKL